MPWSPTPATPERQHRTAWFPSPPAPEPRTHQPAWFPRYRAKPSDTGIGQDLAAVLPRIPAIDTGIGADRALASQITELLADAAVGRDTALLNPKLYVADAGLGADLARPGVRPADTGVGADPGQARPRYAVIDRAVGADMLTSLRPRTTGGDAARGADTATAGFSAWAAVVTPFTASGTYAIPVACRYIDIIVLSGGGGGGGAQFAFTPAQGGDAGVFAWITLERGVHIPWAATAITINVGGGGSAGTGAGSGGNGGASSAVVNGATVVTAAGGTGRGGTGTQNGDPVSTGNTNSGRSLLYNSVGGATTQYDGGAESTGSTANVPGSGGRGGSAFSNGNAGARGQVWCRAYQ